MEPSPSTSLGAVIRARRAARGSSLREVAGLAGVSSAYLSQIERGLHEPSLSVLRAVAAALELPLGALLREAGVLEADGDGAAPRGAEAAIHADPALSEAQRFALLSVYRSFVPPARR